MMPEVALTLALALAGLTCSVAATAVLVFSPAGRGRSHAERDALRGILIGVALMGIAHVLRA